MNTTGMSLGDDMDLEEALDGKIPFEKSLPKTSDTKVNTNTLAIGSAKKSAVTQIKDLEEKNYELQKQLDNSDSIKYMNPNELVVHPQCYNRQPYFFELNKEQTEYLKCLLDFIKNDNLDDLESNTQPENLTDFMNMIVSVYKHGGNHQAVTCTNIDVNGALVKTIIAGETRWRSTKWLIENGYSTNSNTEVKLKVDFNTSEKDKLAFMMERFEENTRRSDLCALDHAIQVLAIYNEHIQKFNNNEAPRKKHQKAEGYALDAVSKDIGKEIPTVKKYRLIGEKLGIEFSNAIGYPAIFVNFSNLSELSTLVTSYDPQVVYEELSEQITSSLLKKGIDLRDIKSSQTDKSKLVNKVFADYIKECHKKALRRKSSEKVQNVSVQSQYGFEIKLSFTEDAIKNKAVLPLLNDKVKLEEIVNDAVKDFLDKEQKN